jgi:hypothetical protein
MSRDNSIPGYSEIYDWPAPLSEPLRISDHGLYRDGTYYVELSDVAGKSIPFFFEPFLGRLCYGEFGSDGFTDNAAFLESEFKQRVIARLGTLAAESPDFEQLRLCLERAKTWAPS